MVETKTVGWHVVEMVPARAREVVCSGDEAQTTSYSRWYVERAASGWWLYHWTKLGGELVRCRELNEQCLSDQHWIASWSN